jgi:predicted TIM-barrel fold metal-dependent hydrolase
MPTNILPTIDADGHVQEPDSIWARYLPDRLKPFAPRRQRDSRGRLRTSIGTDLKPLIPVPESMMAPGPEGGRSGKARLAEMDRQRIERSVLFPTTGLMFPGLHNLELQVALSRAYNDWLREFCEPDPKRLLGVAVVPQLDPVESVSEARRAVTELGFRGIMVRPNPIGGRCIDDSAFDPLFSLCEELDVPLCIHEGTTQDVPQSGLDRYDNFAMRHVASHPHEQQLAMCALVMGGVLERHPKLRALFLESGCGWLPYWMDRMDEHVEAWHFATAKLPLKPSEYIRRQCFVSCDPNERMLLPTLSLAGEDVIVFATDYPHPDAVAGDLVGHIDSRAELSREAVEKVLVRNAQRCFALN